MLAFRVTDLSAGPNYVLDRSNSLCGLIFAAIRRCHVSVQAIDRPFRPV